MNKKENPMNISLQGILFGILLSLSVLLFIGATNDNNEIGRYEYYINSDDVTKKHYSRIFDTSTGVVYHKTFTPGGDQVDVKWVNGERIERRHFRPDLSVWRSESWEDYKQSYEENRYQSE